MDDGEREAIEEQFSRARGLGAELQLRRLAGEEVIVNPLSDDLLHLIGGLSAMLDELGMRYLGIDYIPWLREVAYLGAAADVMTQARAALDGS